MASVGVAPTSGPRESSNNSVGVDSLLEEMSDMKIHNDKVTKMAKNEVLTVKDAVHKLQLYLLEGIENEKQLLAAGSLMSRSDYQDVVTERTIAHTCGYPLCSNSLPSEQPRKGRYRISLKEHKVYDLQETYMYCSATCLIHSRAFSASLLEERSSTLNTAKIKKVLNLCDGLGLESAVNMGKDGDLEISNLKIHEKADTKTAEVSLDEWIGPSNAIDGYVPKRDQKLESQKENSFKKDVKQKRVVPEDRYNLPNVADFLGNDMDFTSTIITQDEYSISKAVAPTKAKEPRGKAICKEPNSLGKTEQKPAASLVNARDAKIKKLNEHKNLPATDINVLEDAACLNQSDATKEENLQLGKPFAAGPSQNGASEEEHKRLMEKQPAAGPSLLKSSLRTKASKKETRSVTWADNTSNGDGQGVGKLNDDEKGAAAESYSMNEEASEESYRLASAEACARALSEAEEAVSSGKSDVSDAVSEAGVTILPPSLGLDESKSDKSVEIVDTDPVTLKWPPKPGTSNDDLLDSEDSWYDSPPDGFNLNLSSFSTMFMAIFAWISSSSLAYIYGKEESFHEDYLSVNGREYPRKIVLSDGRSSEIKQTLADCLSRALPGLVAEIRLPIPISILEQGIVRLLETMSFTDSLPGFRMKQWQVLILLFLDALSVSRIPTLAPYLMGSRIHLPRVLEGAHISTEEYELMKDLIIPLGRVPQFSTQSGG
ncbi:putative RNA polymerase II subunit B1 CTD phosphatase RPAP2 homolog [Andrographis paniculata]|uniref:putative RNA polymerase II subunit B1 CTD phosphatase RPAP2 homolog n=1 Tax=Andrographis paniculata TaxID=175694 RepID=UPI0021E8833E|nr:putative RNA polymerase II subunit B1 CTD phosphatase RPAP2 homolog [Andrographis paniculata]XP_051122213.1 putative RNA polymerase II subunit B1 CTD phosphatase RPAP2 homolog [Andrographis paniculata]XP_051122214.1 putative RNA polymerase II subunit B1 CTD phosphatase RPAP2 homolog [Andrographis paniculata]XP_051122215.1 putative RNA polymerase II subunit B1 CTD phosphatase RPAP2 homolog [Andrographis paniculata]XP_051122216.1 putative RNA polymerase II subunit B1 CTD phosphatase RPAP2 homo